MPVIRSAGILAIVVALSFLFGPSAAPGQECAGNTAGPGQRFAAGQVSFTDGAWGFGGAAGSNTEGPLAFQGAVHHTLIDNSDLAVSSIAGSVSLELPGLAASVCPLGTIGYQWLSNTGEFGDQVSVNGVIVGAGMALGAELQAGAGLRVIPRGSVAVLHNRSSATVGETSATGSDTYGSFGAGLLLGSGSAYGGPEVTITTVEDSNPVFWIRAGVAF